MLTAKTHLWTWCLFACGTFALAGDTPKPAAEPEKPVDFKVSDAPPVVVKTVPEAGSEGVDPELKEIRVTFSKKMLDKSWSWSSDEGRGHVIEGDKPAFEKDGKTIVRAVKLKPNTTYAVWLNSAKFDNFKDTDERPLLPYLLVFRTGPGKAK